MAPFCDHCVKNLNPKAQNSNLPPDPKQTDMRQWTAKQDRSEKSNFFILGVVRAELIDPEQPAL